MGFLRKKSSDEPPPYNGHNLEGNADHKTINFAEKWKTIVETQYSKVEKELLQKIVQLIDDDVKKYSRLPTICLLSVSKAEIVQLLTRNKRLKVAHVFLIFQKMIFFSSLTKAHILQKLLRMQPV